MEPQAICLAVLEAEARSDTRSEIVVGDVQETDVISNFDPNSARPGEASILRPDKWQLVLPPLRPTGLADPAGAFVELLISVFAPLDTLFPRRS